LSISLKRSPILEGKIKSEMWRDNEGNEKMGKKIRVQSMNMLSSKSLSEVENHKNEPFTPLSNLSELGDELPF